MTSKSISDDDLCSDCMHCIYSPGEASECTLSWPHKPNQPGTDYIVECRFFKSVPTPGANLWPPQ